jgi:hypothetical protein
MKPCIISQLHGKHNVELQTIAHHFVPENAGLRDTLTPLAVVPSLGKPAAIIMAGIIVLTWSRGGVLSLVAEPLIRKPLNLAQVVVESGCLGLVLVGD